MFDGSAGPPKLPLMRNPAIPLLLALISCLAACTPKPEPPPPEVAPTPKPTPHPAVAARERATELYPDLARRDSSFNRAFVELYEDTARTNPAALAKIDWPITLAHRVATMLGIDPSSPAPPPSNSRLDEIHRQRVLTDLELQRLHSEMSLLPNANPKKSANAERLNAKIQALNKTLLALEKEETLIRLKAETDARAR